MTTACLIMEPPTPIDSLRTSKSLLEALRQPDNNRSTARFYSLYQRFVGGIVRRSGLPDADADEVVQDVFLQALQNIARFESDPARGTFRGWLAKLTRWRIQDRRRSNSREQLRRVDLHAARRDDRTGTGTDPLEQIADASRDEQQADEREWQELILSEALVRLADIVPAKHFQIFTLYSQQNQSVLRVARDLGVSPATVYVVRHRLTKKLRTIIGELKQQIS